MSPISEPAEQNKRSLPEDRFQHFLFIESYGVRIRVSSNESSAIDAIKEMLPGVLADRHRLTEPFAAEHEFYYSWDRSGRGSLYKEDKMLLSGALRETLLDQLGTQIRITVAEFAVERVFVHAGVVALNGKAILIPGKSFSGKTTLVAELVRRGAIYYSDEFAVLDSNGLVHPFAKPLSIRPDGERNQIDTDVQKFGGKSGTDTIPVGLIVFTKFAAKAVWNPAVINGAAAILELIRDTIPIRRDPKYTIAVLNSAIKGAKLIKSKRNEAAVAAPEIIKLLGN